MRGWPVKPSRFSMRSAVSSTCLSVSRSPGGRAYLPMKKRHGAFGVRLGHALHEGEGSTGSLLKKSRPRVSHKFGNLAVLAGEHVRGERRAVAVKITLQDHCRAPQGSPQAPGPSHPANPQPPAPDRPAIRQAARPVFLGNSASVLQRAGKLVEVVVARLNATSALIKASVSTVAIRRGRRRGGVVSGPIVACRQ